MCAKGIDFASVSTIFRLFFSETATTVWYFLIFFPARFMPSFHKHVETN
jgi:hypothetical protein